MLLHHVFNVVRGMFGFNFDYGCKSVLVKPEKMLHL